MAERCLEILAIPENKHPIILDIGCGSGLSGQVLSDNDYEWVGVDISKAMLDVAKGNEVEGDLINLDMGQGLPFRAGSIDYAISVSAIQWLCIAEKAKYNPYKRLKCFFNSLFKCLSIGARCAFQFYPANPEQLELITFSAFSCGFSGGVVTDFPHSSKKRKFYLFLQAGETKESIEEVMKSIPKNEEENDSGEEEDEKVEVGREKRNRKRKKDRKKVYKSREWIMKRKDRQRQKGFDVRKDTKFTGRKRPWKAF